MLVLKLQFLCCLLYSGDAYVSSLEGKGWCACTPFNRLFRDNNRVLDKLSLAQTLLSITVLLVSSEITLPAKDTTTLTVENQLSRLRKLTTTKLLMTNQISRSMKILPQPQAKESISTEGPATSTNTVFLDSYRLTNI